MLWLPAKLSIGEGKGDIQDLAVWGHSCGRSVEGRGCMYDVAVSSPLEEGEGCPSAVACQPQPGSHHPHCSLGRAPAADRAQHSVWMQTRLHLAVAGRDCRATEA